MIEIASDWKIAPVYSICDSLGWNNFESHTSVSSFPVNKWSEWDQII